MRWKNRGRNRQACSLFAVPAPPSRQHPRVTFRADFNTDLDENPFGCAYAAEDPRYDAVFIGLAMNLPTCHSSRSGLPRVRTNRSRNRLIVPGPYLLSAIKSAYLWSSELLALRARPEVRNTLVQPRSGLYITVTDARVPNFAAKSD
jgi:hypothetical protein